MQMRISLDDSASDVVPRSDADADETFRAFTETVEALALQKSVIGEYPIVSLQQADETGTITVASI